MGLQFTFLLLLAATCSVLGLDKMQIVATSGEQVLVKEGGEVNISCTSDQEWFFCLWRHPSGIKECTIQENGTYQSASTLHEVANLGNVYPGRGYNIANPT